MDFFFFSLSVSYISLDQLIWLKGSKLAFSSIKDNIPNVSDGESCRD